MTILKKAEQYIFQLHKYTLSTQYTYHNFNHTLRVINGLNEIIVNEAIPEKQATLLRYAAWFHDAGYIDTCEGHEEISAKLARDFYSEQGLNPQDIHIIEQLILATKLDHIPQNQLQEVIKDADFVHFTDSNYQQTSALLKREIENSCHKKIPELTWQKQNLEMMLYKHRYYTDYAKKVWQPLKQNNLLQVVKIIEKLEKPSKDLKNNHTRTVDTLFRTTLRNHTSLSSIADSKANILLSVNAIIISICLSTLIPKLDNPNNKHLIIPTFILLIFSVVSMIFAIMSTRPKVTSGTFTEKDIAEKKLNILFFGTFHQMPIDKYIKTIKELIKDQDYLHEALIRDLYSLGVVLHRKYTLLRITYTVFTIGIIASVLAFIIAFKSVGF
ncbi:Pycsar system effector family protein [Myroides sp. LJL119]